MQTWEQSFEGVKHGKILKQFFELFFTPEMTEEDKQDFIAFMQAKLKVTLPQLGEQFQVGVENGYSPEDQLTIIQAFLKKGEEEAKKEKEYLDGLCKLQV
jgi:hypothetical protein